jgi:hypothetical protein
VSQGVDTTLTVAGFLLVAPLAVATLCGAPFALTLGRAADGAPPKGMVWALVVAAAVVPPVLAVGVFVGAILASRHAYGPTFFYPWLALAAGAALWVVTALGLGAVVDRLK